MSAPGTTPGPYYLTGDSDLRYVREEASDAVLARIEDGGHVDPQFALSDAEQLANARLIAAASALMPDLYAWATEKNIGREEWDRRKKLVDALSAALSLANEGEGK